MFLGRGGASRFFFPPALTFICIYFMLKLFPGHKVLFLLGYLFLLCSLPSWFGNSLLFFNKDHLSVQGELIYELI